MRPTATVPPLRRLVLAALLPLALYAAHRSEAHDWTSPAAAAPPATMRYEPNVFHPVWAGPLAGAPAAPSARDCHRAPQTLDLQDPSQPPVAQRERRHGGLGRGDGIVAPLAKSGRAEAAAAADALAAAPPAAVAESLAPQQPMPHPAPRPRDEPVSAGVVDDNADFGEFLAYRARNTHLPVRPRDVSERYRLTVHDAAGRPVPDAEVSLHAAGRALPLWARTDAGGQVWLHPAAMTAPPWPPAGDAAVFEVQVRKGAARGSALLKRGQRDALQVKLDARAPLERARLDLVFLVDATGSMGDEIDKLKRSMGSMAEQIARLPSRPDLCFALVAYRDRGDAFFVRASDFSDDLDAFQRQLGALQASGGGDYPEALDEALHTAVHRLSWRGEGATRLVLLVADAPPQLGRGAPWYDDDMQGALARGIKLFAVGASGLDPVGEYVFRQAAQYTGGRFVFLTYARAGDPSSGPGRETAHDVGNYSVESLDRLVVRLVSEELARRPV
ncbi:MAG TPA: VWA domain-containing protein [Methylibium sp.]|nr:VWA domain-containing protein [Methylibium sp.]